MPEMTEERVGRKLAEAAARLDERYTPPFAPDVRARMKYLQEIATKKENTNG